MYILRIEPPPRYNHETSSWTADKEEEYGGSVLTYYNCLEDEGKITVFSNNNCISVYTTGSGVNLSLHVSIFIRKSSFSSRIIL